MRQIFHHVHKIRSQSEATKRRILHAATAISGILLIFLWVLALGSNFTEENTRTASRNNPGPLSALKDNLVGGYINLTASVEGSQE